MKLSSADIERVDAVFADMDVPQHPGAALLVVDHDEIIYRRYCGLVDLETQRSMTTDTSFYLDLQAVHGNGDHATGRTE